MQPWHNLNLSIAECDAMSLAAMPWYWRAVVKLSRWIAPNWKP
jgi:hypothetical protein